MYVLKQTPWRDDLLSHDHKKLKALVTWAGPGASSGQRHAPKPTTSAPGEESEPGLDLGFVTGHSDRDPAGTDMG